MIRIECGYCKRNFRSFWASINSELHFTWNEETYEDKCTHTAPIRLLLSCKFMLHKVDLLPKNLWLAIILLGFKTTNKSNLTIQINKSFDWKFYIYITFEIEFSQKSNFGCFEIYSFSLILEIYPFFWRFSNKIFKLIFINSFFFTRNWHKKTAMQIILSENEILFFVLLTIISNFVCCLSKWKLPIGK